MSAVLEFDEAAHRYTYDGRELISVTQALTEAGLIDKRWFTEEAALRGTAVHAAIHQIENGEEWEPVEPIVGFVVAYMSFLSNGDFRVSASEHRVCDVLRGFAGTVDLVGRFATQTDGIDVIDIKTGHVPEWVGYQTAAYMRCLHGKPRSRRWALNLRADGSYRLIALEKRSDEQVFLAALTVAQAKRGWL